MIRFSCYSKVLSLLLWPLLWLFGCNLYQTLLYRDQVTHSQQKTKSRNSESVSAILCGSSGICLLYEFIGTNVEQKKGQGRFKKEGIMQIRFLFLQQTLWPQAVSLIFFLEENIFCYSNRKTLNNISLPVVPLISIGPPSAISANCTKYLLQWYFKRTWKNILRYYLLFMIVYF